MADTQRIWIFGEGKPPFMFDGVIHESHSSELVTTENPLETGVPVTDHAYMMPDRLEIEGGVGDVWLNMRDPVVEIDHAGNVTDSGFENVDVPWLRGDGGGDTSTRSQRAYQLMRGLQRSAEIFGVQTGLLFYPNMVLRTLTAEQDKDTSRVLFFRASLSEVIRFGTETVTFPPRKPGKTKRQASKKADNGEKKSTAVTEADKAMSAAFSAVGDKAKQFRDDILGAVGIGGQ
jgi:hypothetical protein